jgi:hypothetical protein
MRKILALLVLSGPALVVALSADDTERENLFGVTASSGGHTSLFAAVDTSTNDGNGPNGPPPPLPVRVIGNAVCQTSWSVEQCPT